MDIAKRFDVAVVGLSCVDCVARTDTLQLHVMNLLSDLSMSGGGLSNALTAISGLGLRLGMATRIGNDLYGDYLLRQWERMGVDTGGVRRDPERQTGFSFILNHGEERTPLFSRGANTAFCLEDIPTEVIESSRCLLVFFAGILPALDGAPLLELAQRCKAANTAIIVDVSDAIQADYTGIEHYMPIVNLVVNEEEGFRLTGVKQPEAILRSLDNKVDAGTMFRGVTRKDGVTFSLPNGMGREYLDVPSPFYGRPVHNVIGAGDAFRAGLAAYLSVHFTEYSSGTLDYRAAGRFASGVAYSHLSRMNDICPFAWNEVEALLAAAQ